MLRLLHVPGTFVEGGRTGYILQELAVCVNGKCKMLKINGKKTIIGTAWCNDTIRKRTKWEDSEYL